MTQQGHLPPVTPEDLDVLLDPMEDGDEIQESQVGDFLSPGTAFQSQEPY